MRTASDLTLRDGAPRLLSTRAQKLLEPHPEERRSRVAKGEVARLSGDGS
jgi:hypothetical protein